MSRGGRPVPGQQYIVRNGDDGEDLEQIGVEAYGVSGQGVKIWGANPHVSRTAPLKKGTLLVIPGDPPATTLKGKDPEQLTCMVGGRTVQLTSARILRTMDTGSDGWSGTMPWTPGADPALDDLTLPFKYPRAAVYIGNELIVGGCLYGVAPELSERGRTMSLVGYSFTADCIDSSMPAPYEHNGVTLQQLAKSLLPPMGIKGVFEADPGGAFKRVTADEGDTIFSFFAKLAAQRGCLVSCTPSGDMLFLRAKTKGTPVGTIAEGGPYVGTWSAKYDGRQLYHSYKCITAGVKGRNKTVVLWRDAKAGKGRTLPPTVTEIDPAVPRSRFTTFRADDVTQGNVKGAARWKRNKQYVDALTIEVPVVGWLAPDGKPWRVNTLVTVVSPTLRVPQGFTFLIRAVEFTLEPGKRAATLSLVPPEAYNKMELDHKIWK